jgi:filamentous hemagglutinin family protein
MNARSYKTVFSKRLGELVAVGEHASSHGKANGAGSGGGAGASGTWAYIAALSASFALVSLAWAAPAINALPTGGQVVQGAASMSQTASQMTIHQASQRAAINWQSFDIGAAAKVNVVQPNAQSVLLNRVVGQSPSQIFGQLNANGHVILVNPNGVLFGKDGSVNAASFTASTLGISDANFMAGNMVYERNGSTAGIVNEGTITTAPGGYVALLGASVSNQGQIDTRGGNAFLGAADTIKVPVSSTGRIKLELTAADMNATVSNTGSIITQGGQVYMQALALNRAAAQIIQSGSIDTTGEQGGAVNLLADGGLIRLSGSIKANSNNGTAGGDIYIGRDKDTNVLAAVGDASGANLESKGGFVETSGDHLKTDGITVRAKDWLLDPDNIDITGDAIAATAGYSKIKASDIAAALNAGTSVTVATTAAHQSNQPVYSDAAGSGAGSAVSGDGNILVNAAIVKTTATAATLTLSADNGITVNQRIGRASGDTSSNSLTVNMTALGNASTVTNSSGITLNNVIDAGSGNVTLAGTNKNTNGSSRGVTFANNSGITANTITVTGTATGAAEWNQGVFFHGTSSIRATGTGSSLISGISSSTAAAINSAVVFNDGSNVTLDGGTGGLTVQGTHTVGGYGGIRFGANGGSSTNPSLTTRGNVTLGTQDSNNTSLNASFMVRNGLITADTGSLTIKGQGSGTGINFYDSYGVIKSNGASIALNGVATSSGHGVLLTGNQIGTLNSGGDVTIIGTSSGNGNKGVNFTGGNVRVYGNNVTINGTANTTSGQTSYGFYSFIGPGAGNTITAAGNLSLTGTVIGGGSGIAVSHNTTSWQNLVNAYTSGGTLSITGTNNAATSNTSATITMAGVQASAGGDLTVSATTNNAATDAISIYSASYLSGGVAPGYQGGASSFVSTGGNTVIKSNQGSILIQDGVPNSVTSTAITGKNVIIDNTGGTFTGGVFTAGSGASTSTTRAGVQISDGLAANDLYLANNPILRTITASDASGQIVFSGKSTGSASVYSVGARISSTASFVAPTTNLLGTSTTSVGVYNTAAITTSKDLNITGVSSSQTNQQGGVTLNGAITTGATGKVNITATDTAGGSNWAYNQNAGANINAGTGGVTINATGSGANSTLNIYGNISTTGAVNLTGNAGTGGGSGIWTSGTVGISGTSVTMNGTGGTTGGVGAYLNANTTVTATTGDVSITGSKPSSTSTAAINFAGTINGGSTKNVNLTGGLTGAGSIVTNGAAVNLNNSLSAVDNSTVVISGNGSLTNQTGMQALSGTNTYSGTTTVTAGTLQVGNAGTTGSLGSGTATVATNANLTFNRYVNNAEYSIPNVIAGSGTLNIVGPGIEGQGAMRLGADNSTFTGTINVSSARLWVTAANQVGSAALINVNSGGGLYAGSAITLNNPIALAGNGWRESGASYYGAIRLGDGATLNGDISLTGNARIATAGVISATLTGVISGANNVEFASYAGPGTIRLTGNNTYTGTTTISSGILQLGTGGTSGSLGNGGVVTNTGTLTINRSNAITIGNSIQSTGALTQAGTGTTTLTGANTYSGTTTISAGTLQVGNGGATGTLGSGAVVDNAALVFNRDASADLTVSGAISGTGSLTQSGAGKTILTGGNSYSGTTTINTGTLQVGSGGATGTLGSGGVLNNAALIFNRNATTDLSVANAISGTGSVEQAGAGKTILSANNSYSGATSVSGGILQVGNGGSTGTLGSANSVALSNNATLVFNKNVNTTIDKTISGNGNVTATITGDLALTSNIALTGTNTINLTASGAITETAGTLAATNLYLTATNGAIGAVGNRIQSNVTNLSFSAGSNAYLTEANAVTVSGRTTANNGNIDIVTTNGTMSIGSVNSINGITAHGTGNITMAGNASTGHGISINNTITASNGDVNLTGRTSSTVNYNAGVFSQSTVAAKNITMVAESTSTTGSLLGYYGAGGVFNASQQLSLTGTSNSFANGLYSYTGSYLSGTGMTLVGSSTGGQGMGFDRAVTVTNSTSGGINITGTAMDDTKQAIGFQGVAITNGGGALGITANNGQIYSGTGNAAWGAAQTNTITNNGTGSVLITAGNGSATNSGSIDGSVFSITQNANAGVVVSTSGTGNVTSPKIINAGTGDIVVAAGSLLAAGTATGGQVLTVVGNTLTQTNGTPGKTYVYSGAPSTTGVLSNLSTGFSSLYYQGTSAPLNAGFNQGFDANHANDMSVPGGGSASGTQVFFRTATKPSFSMTLSNNTKAYGATDPAGFASTSGATLTNAVAGVGGNNTFAVTTADVLAGLTGGRAAGENVGSYAYSLSANSFNTTLTAQPNLVIGRRDITLSTLVASNKVYDGSTLATITSGTFGNLFNGETLLISGQGLFGTKDVADGKTVTVADVSTLTKANGTGNWSNYNLTTTSKTTTANITKATLTATARDDARFVTQADTANFAGLRFSGFKLGDTEAVVDTSGVTFTRTNAVNDTAQGTYLGVLVPTGASAVNYDFTYVNGNYTIVPARQLLVRTTSQSVVYGASPTYATTAAYLDGNGVTINTLTRTGTNNNYTFNDGAGTSVTMTLKPYSGSTVATQSTSGNTVVGHYDVKDLAYSQTGTNFLGTPVFVGTLSVTPKEITPNATGVSKVYDATTSMTNVVVGMTGKITNDRVNVGGTGAFSQSTVGTNLGYSVTGVSLSSNDVGNYYLTNGANSLSGSNGAITPAPLTVTANSLRRAYNGSVQSVSGFTVTGLLGNDSINDLVGISALGASAMNVGTYTNAMTVMDQANYTVTGINGLLTIDPRQDSQEQSPQPVVPIVLPQKKASSGNKVLQVAAQAAVATIEEEPVNRVIQSCSLLDLEPCECRDTALEGLAVCWVPRQSESGMSQRQSYVGESANR